MSIRSAKLKGARAAAEAHYELGIKDEIRSGVKQVDVFAAIHRAGIPILCRPLEGLLGAFVKSQVCGILVTTNRMRSVQRFTAAHELGHYWLKHHESFDSEDTITLARKGSVYVSEQEIEAESFASEFLMPTALIYSISKRLGWNRKSLTLPRNVYQLSLRLGTSYESTVRALVENKILEDQHFEVLLDTKPKSIKDHLLGRVIENRNPWGDVFHISEKDAGSLFEFSVDDTIILDLMEHTNSGYLWDFTGLESVSIIENGIVQSDDQAIGGMVRRRIVFQIEKDMAIELEEKRPWENSESSISSFNIQVALSGKEFGLPRAARV